jgi:hypothetical protein
LVQDRTQDVARDRRLGNLSTPISVQKLQMALHAKAKSEAGYRFYALYDKIYREDILAHAYAQCRSNKGAPGVDRQDFADVEAYGVPSGWRNWRLRSERRAIDRTRSGECSYRKPMANFGPWVSRPCGSGVHDGSDAGARTDLRSGSSPSSTPTGRAAMPSRRRSKWKTLFLRSDGRR